MVQDRSEERYRTGWRNRWAEALLNGEVKKDSEIVVGMSKKEIKFIPKATK